MQSSYKRKMEDAQTQSPLSNSKASIYMYSKELIILMNKLGHCKGYDFALELL